MIVPAPSFQLCEYAPQIRQRGNPIMLPGAERGRLLDDGVNFGRRNLIERHPEAVARVEAANPR